MKWQEKTRPDQIRLNQAVSLVQQKNCTKQQQKQSYIIKNNILDKMLVI